jgi:hypothetical protein
LIALCFLAVPVNARAQEAPPLLTTDPGTPGNGNWEINLGVMPVLRQHQNLFQVPQIDVNFGLGDRIQLTWEIPYVLQSQPGRPTQTGWGNALPGVKWRFLDTESGWQVSVFPQVEPPGFAASVKSGISNSGVRLLLPVEIEKSVGPVHLSFEGGYYIAWHSYEERILGFAVGRGVTPKLEIMGEVYNDYAMGRLPHDTTFDGGGTYNFHKGFLLLFMAGRSFRENSSGQPEFIGYIGVRILLTKYGKQLQSDP